MIGRIYSIYDVKALAYTPPFLAATDGIAVRMVKEIVDDKNTTVGRHPADFKLYCIGTFDDQRGMVLGISPGEHIVDAVSLVDYQAKLPIEEAAQ